MKKWLSLLLIALAILFAIYAIAFLLGKGHISTAKGATTPTRPTKAWIKKGKVVKVTTVSGQAQAASDNTHRACTTHWTTKKYSSVVGLMFSVKITKTWCYSRKRHRVTTAPPPMVQHSVTTVGSLLQWDDKGIDNQSNGYFPYDGYPLGGHRSWVQVQFKRCFPSPFGCVPVDSENMSVSITGNYDGSYTTT